MIKVIESSGKVKKIIKELNPGGQKFVYIVDSIYGLSILKVMKNFGPDKRAEREIEILKANCFHHVPKVYDTFSICHDDKERMCILEEYIDGCTLRDLFNDKKLSKDEILLLTETLLKVAVDIEAENIVHRDIKPDNIIVSKEGKFYLIDFGIARILNQTDLTIANAAMCPHTPGYGAPELIKNDRGVIDIRADLYSIGIVVLEGIGGEHPFLVGGEKIDEIYYKTLVESNKNIEISWDSDGLFLNFINMLTEKIVTKRPQNALKAYGYYKAVLSSLE